jgi:hypothetical protein
MRVPPNDELQRTSDGNAAGSLLNSVFDGRTKQERGALDLSDFAAILGDIRNVEIIGVGRAIRELSRPAQVVWAGSVEEDEGCRQHLHNGDVRLAELHWYEAHGIGKKEVKRKRYLD